MDLRISVAIFLWIGLVATALFPVWRRHLSPQQWWRTIGAFALLLAFALPVWRLRSLLYDGEINVDESQTLAQALKTLNSPLPWRSFVGGSSGPLNTWVLLWAPALGLKLGYLTARLTSLLCAFATLVGCALALGEFAGKRLALLICLPATTLLLTTLNFDFVHLSSEQFPAALCAWTAYLLAKQSNHLSLTRAYFLGAITSAFPFAKLQVAPAGILLFLLGIVILWTTPNTPDTADKSRSERLRASLVQCLGGLTIPSLILGPVALSGAWNDFLEFYIRWGFQYSNNSSALSISRFLFEAMEDFSAFLRVLITGSIGALLLQFFLRQSSFFSLKNLMRGLALLAIFGIHLYGIMKAGYGFPHYLMLLVVPSTLLLGWCANQLIAESSGSPEAPVAPSQPPSAGPRPRKKAKRGLTSAAVEPQPGPVGVAARSANESSELKASICVAAALLGLFQAAKAYSIYEQNPRLLGSWGQEANPIADALKKIAQPGDSLCIWGWYPKLHVFSQLRPATRFAVANLPSDPEPLKNPTLRAFLEDVQAAKPAFFVDASDEFVFPGTPVGSQPRHESFPEFSRWIQSEYTLIASPQTHPARRPVLIYRRN